MSKRKKLITKLDKKWSAAIIKRDNNICQKCGEYGDHPHHVFLRRYVGSRFIKKNGITLCTLCHREAHDYPSDFMSWWIGYVGIEVWEYVRMKAMELKVNIDEVDVESFSSL